jgi:uncharacterized protein (TIGR03067 family)
MCTTTSAGRYGPSTVPDAQAAFQWRRRKMWRGSALIVLAGALSCKARPDAQPASEANAQPASEADSQPGSRPDAGNLQGTWRVVGAWVEGRPSAINVKGRSWTFQDSTIATAANGKIDQRGTVHIDSTSSPARMDFFLRRDPTSAGILIRRQIYRLSDDTLTVAWVVGRSREAYPGSLDITQGVIKLKLVKNP